MKPRRVVNTKKGLKGWQYRFTDPVSGRRVKKTFWNPERRDADRSFAAFVGKRESRSLGIPDGEGWKKPYSELVELFIRGYDFRSEERRVKIQRQLGKNPLGLHTGSDLANKAALSISLKALKDKHGDCWAHRCVQAPLKQMSSWLASVDVFPVDPLSTWKRIKRESAPRERRAFTPAAIYSVFRALRDLDKIAGRNNGLEIVFRALLFTGARPSALCAVTAKSLQGDRIILPDDRGCKRNGLAYLPDGFLPELQRVLGKRRVIGTDGPLLASPKGKRANADNLRADFQRALFLYAVRKVWPCDAGKVDPVEVAYYLHKKRNPDKELAHRPGDDGAPAKNPAKITRRRAKLAAIEELGERLRAKVDLALAGLDMYALRKTHITWARRAGVNPDSVRAQVGHAGRDIEEKHYVDPRLVDAKASAEAVWKALAEVEDEESEHKALRLVVNAEGPDLQSAAPVLAPGEKKAGKGESHKSLRGRKWARQDSNLRPGDYEREEPKSTGPRRTDKTNAAQSLTDTRQEQDQTQKSKTEHGVAPVLAPELQARLAALSPEQLDRLLSKLEDDQGSEA